jgi:hypothetical protein
VLVERKAYNGAMGMNRTFTAAVAALIVAVGFAGPVAAGPVDDADAAYKMGDYAPRSNSYIRLPTTATPPLNTGSGACTHEGRE